jgi:hypothetical protein
MPPQLIVRLLLFSSRGVFEMKLTTPESALAPQTAEAGPRITSTCFSSKAFTGTRSQAMKPKKSRYRLRPSSTASCEVDNVDVAPRMFRL